MKRTVIVNAHVVSPGVDLEGGVVVIEDGRIKSVRKMGKAKFAPSADTTVVDVGGQYVMPGFIDVHTHGALGYDFCDADPDAIFQFAKAKLEEGVTTFLPTTLTVAKKDLLRSATRRRRRSTSRDRSSTPGAAARRIRSSCESPTCAS